MSMDFLEQEQKIEVNPFETLGQLIGIAVVYPAIIGVLSLIPTFFAWIGWLVSHKWVSEVINYTLPKANFWGIWGVMLIISSIFSIGRASRVE
jgi:hypothetical protein